LETIAQADDARLRESDEWKMGGRTVLFGALGYGTGPVLFLTTASVFIRPTMEATGWSTSEVLISPIVIVLLTLLGPLVGGLVDRHGARRAILLGMIPYVILLILFAVLPVSRITFYCLAIGIGIFGAFGYQIPYSRAIASQFDKGAGKAFGIVGVGGAAMPLLGIPLVTLAIYRFGWQAGYLVLAAFALLVALPAARFGIKERSVNRGDDATDRIGADSDNLADNRPGMSRVRRVMFSARFWIFSLHIFLVGGAASAFLSNMQPIMLDGGLSVTVATSVTTLFTGGIIFGRLMAGVLMDLMNRYAVAIGVFTIAMLGALAIANVAALPVWAIALAAFLTAAGQGAEGDIGAYFILKEYGREDFGTLFAMAGIFGGASALIAPFVFSHIRDASGSYSAAIYLGSCLYAAGSMAIILFGALGRKEAARLRRQK